MNVGSYYVGERIFMLDCARKYFTPEWIKQLVDEISAVGYNALNIHFSESNAIRLESKRYPWLAGADHTLCGFGKKYGMPENDDKFYTQDQMREIVRYANSKGLDIIPSLDSPGHMAYASKKYRLNCGINIGNFFHKNGKVSIVPYTTPDIPPSEATESLGIDISNPYAIEFAKNLYEEYGLFFRELGCKSFDIGGDELLGWGDDASIDASVPKWHNLEHWEAYARKITGNPNAVAYDAFILYMNEIALLLRSMGYESIRMWNDDVYRIIKNEKKTVIMVTHDLAEAVSMADRVIVLTKRPASVKKIFEINLTNRANPIANRKCQEFSKYYEEIWKELDLHV